LRKGAQATKQSVLVVLGTRRDPGSRGGPDCAPKKILFIIFVDAIFTTLFERLFTNVSDVTGAN
jgi:hypothetical protein